MNEKTRKLVSEVMSGWYVEEFSSILTSSCSSGVLAPSGFVDGFSESSFFTEVSATVSVFGGSSFVQNDANFANITQKRN